MLKELIVKNRSYRRFYEAEKIHQETLLTLVDYARLSATGANKQTLRYMISFKQEDNAKIYTTLAWAGYLSDWSGPVPGERPSGYIIILQDNNNKMVSAMDPGIAAQSILLGAAEMGLGGCMVGNIQRDKLREQLQLEDQYEILLVIALGKPKETVVIDEIDAGGDIKYWRDENQVHHVPKIKREDIVLPLK